jgi:uncharacterized DUF497 family protein
MGLRFEWDEEKAETNLRKHKVSFEEATSVFDDEFVMVREDSDHSEQEEGFINVGMSVSGTLLVVVHTER